MNMRKKYISTCIAILAVLSGFTSWAQDSTGNNTASMTDTLRSNGKIYVVIAVLVTILFGLLLYIVQLDRKITNLEKNIKK